MTVQSIHHANIRARADGVARLKHFYCEVLGLQEGYRPPFASNGYWQYAAGQPVLHLVEGAEISAGAGAVDHISFCCSELDSVKAKLKERGLPYQITQVPVLGHKQLFFRDPLGLGVELTVLASGAAWARAAPFAWLFVAGFALLLGACAAERDMLSRNSTAADDCAPSGVHTFICGAQRPEDVARIPNTTWLVFSGFADGAGLKLVDTRTRTMRRWYEGTPQELDWDRSRFGHCPSPPDPSKLNAQGLSLRTTHGSQHDLYVVNHGGRESIEVFRIDARDNEPRIRWIGCVLMPPATPANSVATYSDGTILASVLTHPGTSITDFVNGAQTGGVYEWRPGAVSFSLLPGTRLRGNNGIETSLDDREFYVVVFGEHAVVVYSRTDTLQPSRKLIVPNFMPDNLHWDGSRLILAGMQYDEPACGGTRKVINGKADDMRCGRGYTVAALNPVTLELTTVAYSEPVDNFNGVSAAWVVGSELWLAAYQGDRIAVRPLPGSSSR